MQFTPWPRAESRELTAVLKFLRLSGVPIPCGASHAGCLACSVTDRERTRPSHHQESSDGHSEEGRCCEEGWRLRREEVLREIGGEEGRRLGRQEVVGVVPLVGRVGEARLGRER